MKVRPTCAACILLSRSRELERLGDLNLEDALAGFRMIAEVTGAYIGPDIELSLLSTISFRKLKTILGEKDPYRGLKEEGMKKAKRFVDEIRSFVKRLEGREKFHFALKTAAAGNAADYAKPYLDTYIHTLDSIRKIELRINEVEPLYDKLEDGEIRNVVYVLDGAVEALYDSIFIEVLNELGASITLIVKSDAFEDDATISDISKTNLASLVDEVLETGSDAGSLIPDEVTSEVLAALKEADIVIAKGSLNYLHFANNTDLAKNVYSIMRVPCKFLSRLLNTPLGSYVAVRVRPLQ